MTLFVNRPAESLLPAAQVLARYCISDMTLFRWLKNPHLKFPKPIRINGRRYWRVEDLCMFEKNQVRNHD